MKIHVVTNFFVLFKSRENYFSERLKNLNSIYLYIYWQLGIVLRDFTINFTCSFSGICSDNKSVSYISKQTIFYQTKQIVQKRLKCFFRFLSICESVLIKLDQKSFSVEIN